MPAGSRKIAASRSAAASRSSNARKASPASARLGRRTTSAHIGRRPTSDERATSSQRARGGRPSGGQPTGGPSARSRQQLYQEAKSRNIRGRSTMTKAELERALGR
jgi:hypothetical protein